MRFLLPLIALLVISAPVFAEGGGGCYSAKEAEAEQGIRIHSELMVIGLNCQHMTPRGRVNFYQQYREITNRHADLFSGYESTLINYYNGHGGNAERKIHDLRTSFANKISTDAAKMRPDIFCSNFVRRLSQVDQMSRAELQQWASMASVQQPLTQPVCH